MNVLSVHAFLLTFGCLAPALPAWAQGADESAATGSLGGGTSRGAVLTREALRACLAAQVTLNQRRGELERQRGELDALRQQIGEADESLKADRAIVERHKGEIDVLNVRLQEHSERIQAWNGRQQEVAHSTGAGPSVDRARAELETERAAIEKASAQIEAERAALRSSAEASVNAFQQHSQARDRQAQAWNEQNRRLADASQALHADREHWSTDCGDRRYRTDDEIAIRRGQ